MLQSPLHHTKLPTSFIVQGGGSRLAVQPCQDKVLRLKAKEQLRKRCIPLKLTGLQFTFPYTKFIFYHKWLKKAFCSVLNENSPPPLPFLLPSRFELIMCVNCDCCEDTLQPGAHGLLSLVMYHLSRLQLQQLFSAFGLTLLSWGAH